MKNYLGNEGKSSVTALLGIFAVISLCILGLLFSVYLIQQKELADVREVQLSLQHPAASSQAEEQSATEEGRTDVSADREMNYEYVIDADFYTSSITDGLFSRINGKSYTEAAPVKREELRYIHILHVGVDGAEHEGELIVNESIARDVLDIFYELYQIGYVLEQVVLIDEYGGDDNISMEMNNTSGFNARKIADTQVWSNHAYGLAIDINPLYNPYVSEKGDVLPEAAGHYTDRGMEFDMKIDAGDECLRIFAEHGFTWGGSWENVKDYMHFEKH